MELLSFDNFNWFHHYHIRKFLWWLKIYKLNESFHRWISFCINHFQISQNHSRFGGVNTCIGNRNEWTFCWKISAWIWWKVNSNSMKFFMTVHFDEIHMFIRILQTKYKQFIMMNPLQMNIEYIQINPSNYIYIFNHSWPIVM